MSKFPRFDRSEIKFLPVRRRRSKFKIADIAVKPDDPCVYHPAELIILARRMQEARAQGKPIVLCMGAHAIKNGCGLVINRLIDDGWITHVAINGAASIHDWEFAAFGESTECVKTYVTQGKFGLWKETGEFFGKAARKAYEEECGFGEVVAEDIFYCLSRHYPWLRYSVQGRCAINGIPLTIHPGIGQDIYYAHPLVDLSIGCSVTDFLIYAETIRNIGDGGIYLSVGSAIMSPMIFEKSLSMSRNVAQQSGSDITKFHIAVNDVQPCPWDWAKGEPPMDNPAYYLRFFKSFSRMGAETLRYFEVDNRLFLHGLCSCLTACETF